MKKLLAILALLSVGAWAVADMRAIPMRGYNLYKGPSDDYGPNGEMVKPGEDLYVIGSSVGGSWIRVVRKSGGSGWIPVSQVKLERVAATDLYEVQDVIDKEGRYQSIVQFDGGLSSGSLPFGKGIAFDTTVNFAPSGVLGHNTDQVEFGGLVSYHLGREVFGYIKNDTTKYKLNEGSHLAFPSYGLFGQWLFRSGQRGALMIGPRGGFMMSKLNYGDWHYPLMGGVALRYFTGEIFGWSASAMMTIDSSVYFVYTFGVSFRI